MLRRPRPRPACARGSKEAVRRSPLTKAVILAGGRGSAVFPLTSFWPKLSFPIGHDPLLAHQLAYLHGQGIRDVAIVSSAHRDSSRESILAATQVGTGDLALHWHFDNGTKGTAGALWRLRDWLGTGDFLVLQGNLYIRSLDLAPLLRQHQQGDSGLSIVVEERRRDRADLEHIVLDEGGRVRQFDVPHYTRLNDDALAFSGLYLFNSHVLELYDDEGYVDIKEQLLPLLHAAGVHVRAIPARGALTRLNTLEDYFRLNGEYLLNGVSKPGPFFAPLREILPRVWVGAQARVSPHAFVVGPVVIGKESVIEDGAELIGPCSLGPQTHVESGARVRESIVWGPARVQRGAQVEFSLVTRETIVPPRAVVHNTVLMNSAPVDGQFQFMNSRSTAGPTLAPAPGGPPPRRLPRGPQRVYPRAKRLFDLCVAAAALVLVAPLMVVIGLAIKLSSRGPVLFSQLRCGREGREFRMYKFRTMVQGADRLQEQLARRKDTDGPMFKLERDPRITRLGRLLRKTSLDELPQLYNVLRGEMSLVGPRPLAMQEMRCAPSWRDIRLSVPPGITGLWQVEGRSSPYFHDWIEYDVHYVLNQSAALDLRILWKTVRAALGGGK